MTEIIQLSTAPQNAGAPVSDADSPVIRTDTVYVVFTTVEETLAAVRVAATFADAMAVPLTVVHFRAVPFPLSVEAPVGVSPVETNWFAQRLRAEGVDAQVRVFLCRHTRRAVATAIRRRSLIVIGGRRSWWPTRSERWRRYLEGAGHLLVFVDRAAHSVREGKTDA